jgi:hypothetical protein
MLLTLLGALSAGVLAACVAFAVNRATGRNLRWLVPAAFGGAMLAFTIWNDYDWIGRQRAGLPEDIEVVATRGPQAMFLKPWSYIATPASGYVALDRSTLARHPDRPELARARVIVADRHQPTRFFVEYIDCEQGRAVNVTPALVEGDADGFPEPPPPEDWSRRSLDNPLLQAACREA